MAKKKAVGSNGESISGYFRKVFEEHPSWLNTRSNDLLYKRWLKDHPKDQEVTEKVRQNLSNTKSLLRREGRKKRGRPKKETLAAGAASSSAEMPHKAARGLALLEEQIDDCMTLAKNIDREGLAQIISLLRRARNEVVWMTGEPAEE